MKSLIIIQVEHGETTDGVNEALFNMGIGSQFNPSEDDQWPTASDGATWPNIEGEGYRVIDYSVNIDLPDCFVLKG